MLIFLFVVLRTMLNDELLKGEIQPYEVAWQIIQKPSSIFVFVCLAVVSVICFIYALTKMKEKTFNSIQLLFGGLGAVYFALIGVMCLCANEVMLDSTRHVIPLVIIAAFLMLVTLGIGIGLAIHNGDGIVVGFINFLAIDAGLVIAGVCLILYLTFIMTPIGLLAACYSSDGKFK